MDLLLQVEGCFAIQGLGLALSPDLSPPYSERIAEYSVLVERPDGTSIAAAATARRAHFRLAGYKSVLFLTSVDEEEVPLGSKVWKV